VARPKESCSKGELFKLLGAPHVLDILHATLTSKGPVRFKDLQAALAISPNTLAQRLQVLVAAGLLTRQAFNEIPPRVEYAASAKAHDLWPVFDTLNVWAQKHDLKTPGVPVAVPA
jgi:DNA-binding HxlR family transcriptional regulator